MNHYEKIYSALLAFHGPQGWWPILDRETLRCVYHLNAPRDEADRFEISVGAILTQNVAWKNVEKAMGVLSARGSFSPGGLSSMRVDTLARSIRSAGYYNQKSLTLKRFLAWYQKDSDCFQKTFERDTAELRRSLLSVKGIGPETADSILLYALERPVFVVDAYTRRIFSRMGLISDGEPYGHIQKVFHDNLECDRHLFGEYHALIVAHGKDICKKKNPRCDTCCLSGMCAFHD